jgi:hypothetical protein
MVKPASTVLMALAAALKAKSASVSLTDSVNDVAEISLPRCV